MDRLKFHNYLMMVLIVLMVIAFAWLSNDFRNIGKEGRECRIQPFIYGAKIMAQKQPGGSMSCTCVISGDQYTKSYSFNDQKENPLSLANYKQEPGLIYINTSKE